MSPKCYQPPLEPRKIRNIFPPLPPEQLGEFLSVSEAAALLRIRPGTLYKHKEIPRATIPGIKAVLYHRDTLIKYVLERKAPEPNKAAEPGKGIAIAREVISKRLAQRHGPNTKPRKPWTRRPPGHHHEQTPT